MEKHNLKRTLSIVAGSLVVALVVSILPGNFFVSAAELSKNEAEQIALEKLIEFEEFDEDTLVNISTSKVSPRNDDSYYSIIVKTKDGEYDLTVSAKDGEVKIENKLTEEEAEKLAKEAIIKKFDIDEEDITKTDSDDKYATDGRRPYYIVNVEVKGRVYEVIVYVNNRKVEFNFEITEREAGKLAIARISNKYDLKKTDLKISDVDDQYADDTRNPYYIVTIKDSKDNEYKLMVYINDGSSVIVGEKSEEIIKPENFEEFKKQIGAADLEVEDFKKEFNLKNDKYTNYDDKKTPEASLNMLLKDGKKAAIADFKESGNKEEFKEAKEILKAIKKNEKAEIKKEVKKDNKDDDNDNNDKTVRKTKTIVDTKQLNVKQVLLIALDKAKVKITEEDIREFDKINSVDARNKYTPFEKLFGIEKLTIEVDDENPPAYEIKFVYNGYEYEFEIHATTGKILEYDREKVEVKEKSYDREENKTKNKEEKVKNNGNNSKNNNGNNGKGNNKNNK